MTQLTSQTPTLLFCVGATKSGTSWLHSQLQSHPDCHLKTIKELHYFSMTTEKHFGRALRQVNADITAVTAKPPHVDPVRNQYSARKLQDLQQWRGVLRAGFGAYSAYLDYLHTDIGPRKLIGDVTPAYALLPGETLTRMSELGPDVRFLFLMRDPVERLWSHVRMVCARSDRENFAAASVALMDAILSGQTEGEADGILRRGDYCAILDKLKGAVPKGRFLPVIYEQMFHEGGLQQVSDFLGIGPIAAKGETRVHAGVPLALSRRMTERALAFLQPQYRGVAERLGAVPQDWARCAG